MLPIRRIDEIGGRPAQRLGDPHCQPHAGREFRCTKNSKLARSAMNVFGRLLPGGASVGTCVIEDSVEFAQIPAEPLGLVRQGECNSGSARLRDGDERLRRDVEPTQQEEGVLATQLTPVSHGPNRVRADGVVMTLLVEHPRLLPDHCGQCWPTQLLLASSLVHCVEECLIIEALSQGAHDSSPGCRR